MAQFPTRALVRWYERSRRDLPWRRNVSPYRTWVSEIMLQQTTVAAVQDRFKAFVKRFPSVKDLADAPEAAVLKAWAGLGYYSRARNLHRAAKEIIREHGGIFPSDYAKVLDLPGIGRYSAGAILSIAFGKPYPVLDGNVIRVFCRFYGIRQNAKAPETQRRLWKIAGDLVPADNPGDWNQALMELGATVCLPENPNCAACPLSNSCTAFKTKTQDRLPVLPKRREAVPLKWTCLWIERDGQVLLWKRSQGERFLKGHWGLPEERQLNVPVGRLLRTVRHTITHHQITLEVREARPPRRIPAQAAWVGRDRVRGRLVSSLWLKGLPYSA